MSQTTKEIKPVHCLGRLPDCSRCDELIYESDGEFMFIRAQSGKLYKLNEELDLQRVTCPKCGYRMIWRRAEKYRRTKINQNGEVSRQFKTRY